MVLQCGLKLSIGCGDSAASWKVQSKVSHHLWPTGAKCHELHSNLQMAATWSGLGGVWVRSNYEPKLAVAGHAETRYCFFSL